jgi:hypothetical protein
VLAPSHLLKLCEEEKAQNERFFLQQQRGAAGALRQVPTSVGAMQLTLRPGQQQQQLIGILI